MPPQEASRISRAVARCLAFRPVAAAAGGDRNGNGERGPQHQARDDARGKQPSDRDLADRAVQDEADAGRNDRRQQRTVGNHAGRITAGVAALEHLQTDDAGIHGGVGDRRPRHAAHQRRQRDGGLGQAAVHPPRQHRGELEQVDRDAGVVEEIAGEDEQRDREQREILRLRDRQLDRDGCRQFRMLEEEQRAGNANREGDRHADQHQHRECNEYNQHGCARSVTGCRPRDFQRARRGIRRGS